MNCFAMYSQYQQYQNHLGKSGLETQQPEMVWDGRAWVPSHSRSTYSAYHCYDTNKTNNKEHEQQQQQQQQQQPAQMVETYTRYYHGWKAKETEQQDRAKSLFGESKQEAERQVAWARYYSELASRAAHHYHKTPHAPYLHQLPPAPPPKNSVAAQPRSSTVSKHADGFENRPVQQQQSKPNGHSASDGMKEYVHKCLSQCKSKDQTARMQKEIERMISRELKDGTMHTTDWDTKPLLPVPGIKQEKGSSPIGKLTGSKTSLTQTVDVTLRKPRTGVSVQKTGDRCHDAHQNGAKKKSAKIVIEPVRVRDTVPPSDDRSDSSESSNFIAIPSHSKQNSKRANKQGKNKRKRPSSDFVASKNALVKRANRFAGAGGITDAASVASSVDGDIAKYMGGGVIGGSAKLDERDYEAMLVKGTCQTLEKEYLRLTAPPRAELVRPQAVLQKHLNNLRRKRELPVHPEYTWFCSQLKAIRQDMTVQRIINAFAVEVYETHARIALEEGDLNEFNQCQTQLKELYLQLQNDRSALQNENEFIAYRLLYYVFLTGNQKYEEGSSDLFKIMLSLTESQRQDSFVAHALKVRVAVADSNYHVFFRLCKSCSRHGGLLMKCMVSNIRQGALQRMCRAYRPSVSVEFVLSELGFSESEFDEGKIWLKSCGCVLKEEENVLDTKESVVQESNMKTLNSLI